MKKLFDDDEWKGWSDRQIAKACVVSHPFVAKVRASLTGNVSSERSYVTKHGDDAVMDTTKIGRREGVVAGHVPRDAKSLGTAPEPSSDEEERTSPTDAPLFVRAQTTENGTNVAVISVTDVRRVLGAHADGKLRFELDFQTGMGVCAHLSWLAPVASDTSVPGATGP